MREELEEILWAYLAAEISPEVNKYQVDQQVATSHVQILTASDFAEILCKAIEDKETSQVVILCLSIMSLKLAYIADSYFSEG